MKTGSLGKAVFALAATTILLLLAGVCMWWRPLVTHAIDPEKTPFLGPGQSNAYTIYNQTITDASGRFRAHKLLLVLGAMIFLAGLLGWNARLIQGYFQQIRFPRIPHRVWKSPWFFLLATGLFLSPLALGLRKVPDFSNADSRHMALVNMHFAFIIGHADKIAQGDKLFEQVAPKYGMLLTGLAAGWEKARGEFFSLGNYLRLVQVSELIYLSVACFLFWRWSGRRAIFCLIPVLFLMKWFYSSSAVVVPLNHTPLRTAGIPLALAVLYLLRTLQAGPLGFTCGALAAIAILNNVESGIACTVGIGAFAFSRAGGMPGSRLSRSLRLGLGSVLGFASAWLLFGLAWYGLFGVFFGLAGMREYFFPAFQGAGGTWATSDPLTWWPLLLFSHVLFTLVYSSSGKNHSFRDSFRIALSVMFLVWFVYFLNRSEPTYLCSFYFLYGFLIIDLQKTLSMKLRKYGMAAIPSLAPAALVILLGTQAADSLVWSISPWKTEVNNGNKWTAPLVAKGQPLTPDAVHFDRVFLPQPYAHSLMQRAGFLKKKAAEQGKKRLIYFTVDSFLLPRASRVLPWQEFPDPLEAMTKSHYDSLIQSVIQSDFDEIYFDARDERKLVYYGGLFHQLRRDLSDHFEKTTVQSEWESWRRKKGPRAD